MQWWVWALKISHRNIDLRYEICHLLEKSGTLWSPRREKSKVVSTVDIAFLSTFFLPLPLPYSSNKRVPFSSALISSFFHSISHIMLCSSLTNYLLPLSNTLIDYQFQKNNSSRYDQTWLYMLRLVCEWLDFIWKWLEHGLKLLEIVGQCWILLDMAGHCWTWLDISGHCWILLDIPGYCWASLDIAWYP